LERAFIPVFGRRFGKRFDRVGPRCEGSRQPRMSAAPMVTKRNPEDGNVHEAETVVLGHIRLTDGIAEQASEPARGAIEGVGGAARLSIRT
jgi:hypothetical protein